MDKNTHLSTVFEFFRWVLYHVLINSCYRAARKMKHYGFLIRNPSLKKSSSNQYPLFPDVSKCSLKGRESETLICDINGGLLNSSPSFFPYFMLVAFEGGGVFRAFLLLLSWPFLCFLDYETRLRAMIFISFCGLPIKSMENVCSTVFPKFYLENLNLHAFEILESTGCKVVFTSIPKVMVEGFLRGYLHVNDVIGTELHTYGRYFTGLLSHNGLLVKHRAVKDYFGEQTPHIGIGNQNNPHDQFFLSLCKEAYIVSSKDEKSSCKSPMLPREKYPKPLIFHDGRLAFLPTPLASLRMFIWLPLGIIIAILRLSAGLFVPHKLHHAVAPFFGISLTLKGCIDSSTKQDDHHHKRVLYVCCHKTLLDPVLLSISLRKPLVAVTYSLSKFSEVISPIKTARLTRDRTKDRELMEQLLKQGDLVVCPEGTTCREPYLLRFSPLFAELTDDIVPVAVNARMSMFYGTTASGLKWLDSIFFMMNPRPSYEFTLLPKLPKDLTCAGGKSSFEVANYVQRQLGNVLGFECTNLTRKDKYLMLAGNDGAVVQQ